MRLHAAGVGGLFGGMAVVVVRGVFFLLLRPLVFCVRPFGDYTHPSIHFWEMLLLSNSFYIFYPTCRKKGLIHTSGFRGTRHSRLSWLSLSLIN